MQNISDEEYIKENEVNDRINLKQRKGTWKRFIKLLFRCHIPILLIIVYIATDLLLVNVGISETDYTSQLFAGDVSTGLIFKLVFIMAANLLISNVSIFIRQIATARTDRNARRSVWNKLLHIPMSYFKDEDPQEAVTRIVNNMTCVSSTLIFVLIPLVSALYGTVMSLLKIASYDYRLSLILLLALPFSILMAFLTGRLKYSSSKAYTNVIAKLTERLSELITNIPLAKAFAKEDKEEKRGKDMIGRLYKVNIKTGWIDCVTELSFTLLGLIETVVMVLIGALLLRNQEINKRAWISFFMFSSVVTGYVDQLVTMWHNSKNIQGIIDRSADIMSQPDEADGKTDAKDMHGDIVVDNLTFSYDGETKVFSGFSAAFEAGKVTALLGLSGCGKTTLTNLIGRFYTPDEGVISIGGRPVEEYTLESYRKRFAYVSQKIMLFSGTVKENLTFGIEKEYDDGQLTNILKSAGLKELFDKDGLNTEIGEQGCRLSGGQRQKLALARMMLTDADYIILDEATASMDTVAVARQKELFESLFKDKTVIIIAHSNALMSLADKVVVIEDGRAAIEASVPEAMSHNKFFADFMKGVDDNE